MKSRFIFLAGLLVTSCALINAKPQDFEPDQTSSTDPGDLEVPPSSVTNNLDSDFSTETSVGDGQGNFVLDGNEQASVSPPTIALLNEASEIRQYLVSKLREIYRTLKGCKSKMDVEQATLLDIDHLPKFEDPLYIGNFTEKYKLADVSFFNVTVEGMHEFRSADVHTDVENRHVDLQLMAPSLTISGQYFLKNYFKKTSGAFTVKLCDNITYHESSVYCRMKQEIDIAASKCGIRYKKSENNYVNLGWFTNLFRGAISNPMIDQVLQKVGKEIGHKMRPILLSTLEKTVIGSKKDSDTVVPGLASLIRSTVSEARNLMLKDQFRNFRLEGETRKFQYGTHDAFIQDVRISGIKTFEITGLEMPILPDKIVVNLTVHDTNINGSSVNIRFVENNIVTPKASGTPTAQGPIDTVVPFEMEDLRIDIVLDKRLSNEDGKFEVRTLNVTISKLTTYPILEPNYPPQIAAALRDYLPFHLKSVISARLETLARSHIENILNEAAFEQSTDDKN